MNLFLITVLALGSACYSVLSLKVSCTFNQSVLLLDLLNEFILKQFNLLMSAGGKQVDVREDWASWHLSICEDQVIIIFIT